MTIEEMEDAVANALHLSDEVRAVPHGEGPRTRFDYRLAWVRTYLKKVGALENSERGVWRLTPTGATMSDAEIELIPKRVRDEDRQRRLQSHTDEDDSDSEAVSEVTWKDQLLTALLNMPSDAFERLC